MTPKALMKSTALLGVSALLLLGLTACSQDSNTNTTTALPKQNESIEAFGVVKSLHTLAVIIDFPAKLKTLEVRSGQQVTENTPIATLNTIDYDLQIRSKEIEVKIFGSEKAKIITESSLASADPNYQKFMDGKALAKSNLDQAQKDYDNAQALFQVDGISQKEFENYKLNLDARRTAYNNATSDLELYLKTKQGSQSAVTIKDLQATTTALTLANMKAKLDSSIVKEGKVISPFKNAVVYDLGYSVGDPLDASRKLCSLADLDALIIEAEVTEDFIADVKPSAIVTITPVADRTRTYTGKVLRIEDMAKVKNGETIIGVDIAIDQNDGFLKPNFNVDLSIGKK